MRKSRILIVDDDAAIRFAIGDFLSTHGYLTEQAADCRQAEEALPVFSPDALLADYMMPDGNALELLARLRAINSEIPVVILTGHGSIDLAVRAIKEGAEQFLTKPLELPTLLVVLERVLENQRNRQRQEAGRSRQARRVMDPFLGTSAAIRALADEAQRVADSDRSVLIQGETGSGKGVLARWLHENGPRAKDPFVDLNCAGLSRELLETEIFGHEKGAFTGAAASKSGLLEIAHRGTFFLDEIGDMDLQVQPKLLTAVEEKRFRRLGDVRDRTVDVRLVAATHQDLGQLVREKRFRGDLYFRINARRLEVPPLRQRAQASRCSPAGARAARGRDGAGRAPPGRRGGGGAPGLRVAGQRARAEERPRARRPVRREPALAPAPAIRRGPFRRRADARSQRHPGRARAQPDREGAAGGGGPRRERRDPPGHLPQLAVQQDQGVPHLHVQNLEAASRIWTATRASGPPLAQPACAPWVCMRRVVPRVAGTRLAQGRAQCSWNLPRRAHRRGSS